MSMYHKYEYRRSVRGYRYNRFRNMMRWLSAFVVVLLAIGGWLIWDILNRGPDESSASSIETRIISDNLHTMTSPYFKFQDTSKWVLEKERSTPNMFIYDKFRKKDILSQMIVYVNQVPIPLHLATPRVLPVRLVNDNSLDVTITSDPCGKTYGKDPQVVKPVVIDNATMLCDPQNPNYLVQFSMIGGDYRLNMQRRDGTPVQFVIIFRETTPDVRPQTLIRVAKSFEAL